MSLTEKERAYLVQAEMSPDIISAFEREEVVTITGTAFMSWLRYTFAEGMKHERARRKQKRRRLRIFNSKRAIVTLRTK